MAEPLISSPLLGQTRKTIYYSTIITTTTVFLCISSLLVALSFYYLSPNPAATPFLQKPVLSTTIDHVCNRTFDPFSCSHAVAGARTAGAILSHSLKKSLALSTRHVEVITLKLAQLENDHAAKRAALSDCVELMDQTKIRVADSLLIVSTPTTSLSVADMRAWISGAMTNFDTCLDGLNGDASMAREFHASMAVLSTSLAILANIASQLVEAPVIMEFPSWLTARDRKLLHGSTNIWVVSADVVVAKDGSGKYKTVKEAVDAAPSSSTKRYVIYVKTGTYKEKLDVGQKKTNIMLVGDGTDKTIITGSLNVIDGSTTFNSATLAAVGDGFMAQDLCIQNTAGPEKHQAVALRIGADKAVINRCKIEGYQDTLYTHSLRQFYRDSSISGTVDYIFGNSAVVFQNCNIESRKPLSNQKNTITAQGRTDPNQNTGISIQKCQIVAGSDLAPVKGSIPTYLGRPWKEYSRTIFMQSALGDLINPAGWLEWEGQFALKTLEYREYMNTGGGAGTSKRVNWAGFKVLSSSSDAQKYTVSNLIQGGSWLGDSGVVFAEGL